MKLHTKQTLQRIFLWLAVVVFLSIFILLPFYWMVKTSFESTANLFSYPPAVFIKDFVSVGWKSLFFDQPVLTWLKNSLIVSNVVMVVSMLLATLSAYSLSRYHNKLNKTIGFLVLVTQMLPGNAVYVANLYHFFKDGVSEFICGMYDCFYNVLIANLHVDAKGVF